MGTAELLFMNALSANSACVRYETTAAQELIAQRLDLSPATVSRAWIEIDMPGVLEMAEKPLDERHVQGLPPVAAVLQTLIGDEAQRLLRQANQLHCVVVLPAIGHVAALERGMQEAARLTGQSLTPVIVLWREESGGLRLFHIIPEPDREDGFAAALQQTRACESLL